MEEKEKFDKEDIVYHISQQYLMNANKQKMVVLWQQESGDHLVMCGWMTDSGKYYQQEFYGFELINYKLNKTLTK